MTLTDPELVAAAQRGDLAAFEQLVTRHERRVYALARRMLRQDQDAEDVTQQTFISALEHLGTFRGDASFATWLLRMATYGALKVLRKRRGLPVVSLDEATEPDAVEGTIPHPEYIADWRLSPTKLVGQAETGRVLDEALAELDDNHRVVFLLRDVEGLSVRETAAALDLSEANVKVRLLRARLRLRERLTRAFGDARRRLAPPAHRH